ncbi:hypothetical protein ACFUS2_12995 [[Kitasatospora] papulosa]|uniref:hypothetical protein n=1 Tax=[Kitasatospora] papulosa TaxID=1464011 RepID=UPI0036282AE9
MNVISTNAGTDVGEEYAAGVDALIRASSPDRETTQADRFGEITLTIRLYAYNAPDTGEERWAVDYNDPASRELEEYDTETQAEERYEEMVRDAARVLSVDIDGVEERFTSTDVDGVPGPLPELPSVTPSDICTLLDQQSEEPVLYVERTEDGEGDEVRLAFGPAAYTNHSHILLTREEVLEALQVSDDVESGTDGRITSDSLTDEDTPFVWSIAGDTDAKVRAAVSVLFSGTIPA